MKILNVCHSDWANYSYCNAAALRSVGYDAHALTLCVHSFGYENQAEITTTKNMLDQMREADIIQVMHTCPTTYDLVLQLAGLNKHTVVYHTGTRYRQEPEKYNEMFNPIVARGITDQTEFMKLGIKDVAYMPVAIDTDAITPGKEPGERIVIAHYPSKSQVKGTERLKEMLSPFTDRFNINIDSNIVTHAENLKRMQTCDIYVELFSPMQGGKEYGCYGVTAFEAAAMGKIVVTQDLNKWVYREAYGESTFITPETEELFQKDLEFLASTPHIKSMQKLSRDTMVKRHSYQASGERIVKLLGL